MNDPHHVTVRKLVPADAREVSELAIRSKAVWGYPPEVMDVFRRELSISGDELAARLGFGVISAGKLVGYYTTAPKGGGDVELEHLFVEPSRLRKGLGTMLLNHALATCRDRGIRRVVLLADPSAAGFYERHGARFVEDVPSSIPGRAIPKYDFELVPPEYLEASEVIDWHNDRIVSLADELRTSHHDEKSLARACFEWVRDNIEHSLDFNRSHVTCNASETLSHGTGYCYAKSHLLGALLRANDIPCGFCYQRLTLEGDRPPFVLHGLNAVYLRGHGWYRVDARGNKPGVNAQFVPPQEQLAFPVSVDGESDFPQIWPRPLRVVVDSLRAASSVQSLATCLPDLSVDEMQAISSSRVIRFPQG